MFARLLIYIAAVGCVLFLLSCDLPWGHLPWDAACRALQGPLPESPLEMQVVPHWYVLPFYGVLRSATFHVGPLDPKHVGLVLFGLVLLAPIVLVFVGWSRTALLARLSLLVALAAFVGLGWTATKLPTPEISNVALLFVSLYLVTLFVVFPLLARVNPAASPGAGSR